MHNLLRKPIFQQNNLNSDTNDLKHIFIFCVQKILKLQENLRTIQVLNYIHFPIIIYLHQLFIKALKKRPKYIVEISHFLENNDTGKF